MSGAAARDVLSYYPDPGIRRGPLRVLPRTDGAWIVYDERRHHADRTVAVRRDFAGACDALDELADADPSLTEPLTEPRAMEGP